MSEIENRLIIKLRSSPSIVSQVNMNMFLLRLLIFHSLPTIVAALALNVGGLLGLGLLARKAFCRWPVRLRATLVFISFLEIGQTSECHLQ